MDEKSLKEFFEKVPPGKKIIVVDFNETTAVQTPISPVEIFLHCETETCLGERIFARTTKEWVNTERPANVFVTYRCKNCSKTYKTYSLNAAYDEESEKWQVLKYGESPNFGPPIPTKVFKLIGGERELFIQGNRCENQAMGIGAFVYYRRVIESQKNRIFGEIIRVVEKVSPNDAVLNELKAALNETQFTKAVDVVKHALPQSLFINGYNPLKLLHSALSEGVHSHTDQECLELANSVRRVLFEFSERLNLALKDEAELNAAVNKLANKS